MINLRSIDVQPQEVELQNKYQSEHGTKVLADPTAFFDHFLADKNLVLANYSGNLDQLKNKLIYYSSKIARWHFAQFDTLVRYEQLLKELNLYQDPEFLEELLDNLTQESILKYSSFIALYKLFDNLDIETKAEFVESVFANTCSATLFDLQYILSLENRESAVSFLIKFLNKKKHYNGSREINHYLINNRTDNENIRAQADEELIGQVRANYRKLLPLLVEAHAQEPAVAKGIIELFSRNEYMYWLREDQNETYFTLVDAIGMKTDHHLTENTVAPVAKWLLNNNLDNAAIPRASQGHTPVYLPKEFPYIVIKKGTFTAHSRRVKNMTEMQIRIHNAASKCLIVPRYRLLPRESLKEHHFLLEERINIYQHDTFDQFVFYRDHSEAVAMAIREFARVYFLEDSFQTNDLSMTTFGIAHINPSNLPLVNTSKEEEEKGQISKNIKLSLIDLEFCNSAFIANEDKMATMAILFPHHFDLIMEEAKQAKLNFEDSHLQKIINLKNEALSMPDVTYNKTLEFYRKHSITIADPTQLVDYKKILADVEVQESITKAMRQTLLEQHTNGYSYSIRTFNKDKMWFDFGTEIQQGQGFLGNDPQAAMKLFLEAVPKLLEDILQTIQKRLRARLSTFSPIASDKNFVHFRWLSFVVNNQMIEDYVELHEKPRFLKNLNHRILELFPQSVDVADKANILELNSTNNDTNNHVLPRFCTIPIIDALFDALVTHGIIAKKHFKNNVRNTIEIIC